MKIDFVVPYVNNEDKVWQETFFNYCMRHDYKKIASMRGNRFEDIGLINYQLKLIKKFMPWINTIHLLLSNIEQAPKDLPDNVVIHLHEDFIPHKYLPTFNSTTIEMFLSQIEGLSEYFIYANDDMLPIKELKPSDFFTDDGRIKINFQNVDSDETSGMFRLQCANSYYHVAEVLNKEAHNLKRPEHSFTPMIKSHCLLITQLLGDIVLSKIRAFRTEKQHNQYIYPIYEDFVYGVVKSDIKFFYSHLNEPTDEFIEKLKECQIVCPNLLKNQDNVKILRKELDKLCEQ